MFRVWNVKTGKAILGPIKINPTPGEMVYSVRYSPDGKMISTGGNMLRIWDTNRGKLLKTFEFGIVGDTAWTSDGNTLITGSRRLDIATWTEINGEWLAGSSMDTVLSPNERILASIPTADNRTAQLWNLENHQPIGPPLHHEDEDEISSAVFAADGNLFVTGCDSGRIYAWDVSAILIKAGLGSLQTVTAVNDPLIDANAARRRAPKIEGVRRVPQGFFDDVPRRVNSSTSRSHHNAATRQSTQPGRSPTHNPLSLARNFISGLLRRRDGSAIRLPPVVEVPLTAGKPRNYHARKKPSASSSRPPKPPTTQQQNRATQSNLPSSQQPNATATSSTTPPPVTGTAAAAGTSHPDITIKRAGWRARFLLWVCCVPTQTADGQP
ncbi:WD40 repeat-like protein [Suillus weaverae]|nr:WD40 repeat-like protein [Suillus weaverae]